MIRSEDQQVEAPKGLALGGLRFVGTDWIVLALAVACAYSIGHSFGTIVAMLSLPIYFYVLWPLNNARRYYEWIASIISWLGIKKIRRGNLWSRDRLPGRWWLRPFIRLFQQDIFTEIDQLYDIGLLHSRRHNTDSVAIEVDGWPIKHKPGDEQTQCVEAFGEDIKSLGYTKILKPRVSFVTRWRWQDSYDTFVQHKKHMMPAVFANNEVPDSAYNAMVARGVTPTLTNAKQLYKQGELTRDQLDDFQLFVLNMHDVPEDIEAWNRQYTTVVVLTIPQTARLKRARRKNKPIQESEMAHQDIVRLAERFCKVLKARGFENPHILNKPEFEDFRREGWDIHPDSIGEYREWRRTSDSSEDRSHPEKDVDTDGAIVCFDDDSYHATFRLTGLPSQFFVFSPDFLIDTLGQKTQSHITVSRVSEVVRDTSEYIKTTAAYNVFGSIFGFFGLDRFGPKFSETGDKMQEKQKQLNQDKNVNWFSVYIALAATDPKIIRQDILEVEEVVNGWKGESELITGEFWTYRAINSANIGIADM